MAVRWLAGRGRSQRHRIYIGRNSETKSSGCIGLSMLFIRKSAGSGNTEQIRSVCFDSIYHNMHFFSLRCVLCRLQLFAAIVQQMIKIKLSVSG